MIEEETGDRQSDYLAPDPRAAPGAPHRRPSIAPHRIGRELTKPRKRMPTVEDMRTAVGPGDHLFAVRR
jgi:hypothetical protein